MITYSDVVDCGNLTDPDNGVVTLSGTTEGDTANYSCIVGYELNDNDTSQRTCGLNGTWSGEEPTCIGEYLNREISQKSCKISGSSHLC